MIKKTTFLFFLGTFLQIGFLSAGNYSKCSNACSKAKCAASSRTAEQCSEWCEGIPLLEAVFNACRGTRPVVEHANLDLKHQAEQVKHGRGAPPGPAPGAPGGGAPIPPPPPPGPAPGAPAVLHALPNTAVLYTVANVKAFCQAYAGNKARLLTDHGVSVEEKIPTTQDSRVPNVGDVQIQRTRNSNNQNTHLRQYGAAAIVVLGGHMHTLANPSAKTNYPSRAIYPNGRGVIFFKGIQTVPAQLRLKGLCSF